MGSFVRKYAILVAVLGAIVLLAVALPAGAVTTLSWQTEPILGYNISITGDVFVQTGSGPTDGATIPHYSMIGDPLYHVGGPGVSTFWINPTTWDPISLHFYDPAVNAYSGSGVYLDTAATYHYTGAWDFLGTPGNPAYTAFTAENASFSEPDGFIMLTSGVGGFWPEDVGNWTYTETWTNNADSLDTITSTQAFNVAAVPEPVTMLSVFGAVAGIGAYLRRRMAA